MRQPDSYGQVVLETRRLLGQARLNDPNEHFPYRYDQVCDLIDSGSAMGPGNPGRHNGAGDTSRTVADYTSQGIADATRDFIDAQAAHLADPDDQALFSAYRTAQDRLIAARLDHRTNRGRSFTIGAAARRAG